MSTKATGNQALPSIETISNPNIYQTLQFERGVDDWACFSQGINQLLYHSIKSMGNDSTLADEHSVDCIMTVLSLKMEVEESVFYTLSNIPK